MTHKNELQLAFSGKEIASERIAVIDATELNDEHVERLSRDRREKYQKLLEQSEKRIPVIKSSIAEDISGKQFQLEGFKRERTEVTTRYQLGEISYEECEKLENGIKKKFDEVKAEAEALQQLYYASTSSEIGGQIPIDIDKDVDNYGNIIKKPGSDTSSTRTVLPSLPNIISIQSLSHRNLILLLGVIGALLVIVAFLYVSSTAHVIAITPNCQSHCGGYEWSQRGNIGSVVITAPGEYAFAKNVNFPERIMVSVTAAGVTLDGKGVTILTIQGRDDLDLKNIHISWDEGDTVSGPPISECRNIKNSSIDVTTRSSVTGILMLYGNIDDTTSITVTSTNPVRSRFGVIDATAIGEVYGTVSGGTFVASGWSAAAIGEVYGTVSGGTFTVTGEDSAAGIVTNNGNISGGIFIVNGQKLIDPVGYY